MEVSLFAIEELLDRDRCDVGVISIGPGDCRVKSACLPEVALVLLIVDDAAESSRESLCGVRV